MIKEQLKARLLVAIDQLTKVQKLNNNNMNTTYDIYRGLSNRQLLKAFREITAHHNYVRAFQAEGHSHYLGDPIHKVLFDAKIEYIVAKQVLLSHDLTPNQLKEINSLTIKSK